MKIYKCDMADSVSTEYLPMGNGVNYNAGQAMVITSGCAALATGTATPTYICMGKAAGVTGGYIPAVRVSKSMVYAANLSVAGASLNIGDKVTIAADSVNLTATTTGGVCELVGFSGKAAGDEIYFRI